MLYISHLLVRRPVPSAISTPSADAASIRKVRKYVRDGKLIISSGGKLYDASGTMLDFVK